MPTSEEDGTVRLTGVIKLVFPAKLYGFISVAGDEVEEEYFFHRTALRGVKFEQLQAGDVVTFIPTEGKEPGKPRAVDVRKES